MVSLLLSPESWCTQGSVCALQESVSPVLCKFWWLYGGVNGDLLQEGLCYTQVYSTQSPYPYSSLLLTRTSSGDTQTQFCLSLCGVSGSWSTQGMLEPSEHLWQRGGSVVACCKVKGSECSNACMEPFEGCCNYLHYFHHSLASGQTTGRKHSPIHQQKIGLKIS